MKNYLLMTATVTPPTDEAILTRRDPLLRLNDYIGAFEFYLNDQLTHIDGIIFVDNSNNPLKEIKELTKNYQGPKQIEVISFYGLDYPAEYTRGYGELKLIEYAYENSKLMQQMSNGDRFWKVTGRLKVLSINKIIKSSLEYFELCADFRYKRKQVDTRLIALNIKGYKKYLYKNSHEMQGQIIESWLFNKLTPMLQKKENLHILTEFRVVPRFEGFAGNMSVNYMAPKQRLIYFLRSIYLTTKYFFKPN